MSKCVCPLLLYQIPLVFKMSSVISILAAAGGSTVVFVKVCLPYQSVFNYIHLSSFQQKMTTNESLQSLDLFFGGLTNRKSMHWKDYLTIRYKSL